MEDSLALVASRCSVEALEASTCGSCHDSTDSDVSVSSSKISCQLFCPHGPNMQSCLLILMSANGDVLRPTQLQLARKAQEAELP